MYGKGITKSALAQENNIILCKFMHESVCLRMCPEKYMEGYSLIYHILSVRDGVLTQFYVFPWAFCCALVFFLILNFIFIIRKINHFHFQIE